MSTENIIALMDSGFPVGVRFTQTGPASRTDQLFCELVQQARHGETISFSVQSCPVGAYVLGKDAPRPDEYYFTSGRYINKAAAAQAADSLPRLDTRYNFVELFPVKQDQVNFDVLLLFLNPARAMRIVQAMSYHNGQPLAFSNSGTASVCGECTVTPFNTKRLCLSIGCKGSRKHSRYTEDEMVVGIPHILVNDINEGLAAIPWIFD